MTKIKDKITKMNETQMKKTLFWNSNVAIGGLGGKAVIHRFYDQLVEYKMNAEEIKERRRRDEQRIKEMEKIETEIEQLSNISRKCIVTEPKLYRHPTSRVW